MIPITITIALSPETLTALGRGTYDWTAPPERAP